MQHAHNWAKLFHTIYHKVHIGSATMLEMHLAVVLLGILDSPSNWFYSLEKTKPFQPMCFKMRVMCVLRRWNVFLMRFDPLKCVFEACVSIFYSAEIVSGLTLLLLLFLTQKLWFRGITSHMKWEPLYSAFSSDLQQLVISMCFLRCIVLTQQAWWLCFT